MYTFVILAYTVRRKFEGINMGKEAWSSVVVKALRN
jgi:hypothetical protein